MARLPDFLIAGAPRCGSTSLYRLLDQHPDVFMARPKEIGYFGGKHAGDLAWYAEHFSGADDDVRAGEATPWYLHNPVAVDQMAETVPEAKIIVILRDPVSRAYSHYWMARNRGRADMPFEEFIDSTAVLDVGCYGKHLENLAMHFDRSQTLVVFQEDLVADPSGTYSTVCRFLGVDDAFVPDSLGETVNAYVEFRSVALRRWMKQLPSSASKMRRVVGRLNTRTGGSYPPMDREISALLTEYYAVPNDELASFLGRDLPGWRAPSETV